MNISGLGLQETNTEICFSYIQNSYGKTDEKFGFSSVLKYFSCI